MFLCHGRLDVVTVLQVCTKYYHYFCYHFYHYYSSELLTSNVFLESEKSYVSVGLLKSASQNGAFKNELSSPVVGWHVTYAQVKRRQVVRVRRQAVAQTPVPTSSLVTPTSVIVTQVIGTPVITRSPTMFTVTPTATRVIPSPMQTTDPYTTSFSPSFPTPTSENTPPCLNNPIKTLTAEINAPFSFYIPPDTFLDKEDGQTPRLQLDLFNDKGNEFPGDFWLRLDSNPQVLRGVPKTLGETKVGLIVTDSKGLKSDLHVFIIRVVRENVPPYLYNHIDLIQLYIGQPIEFKVPYDTFHDKEDGATPNLTLSMTQIDDESLDSISWVSFDAKSQTIYALPLGTIIGKYEFLMVAYDSLGKKAVDAFEFHINPLPVQSNHNFALKLDANYDKFNQNVETRVKLCIQIGDYFGDHFNTSYKDIRVKDYQRGSVILEWSFANIATNMTGVLDYKSKYVRAGTEKDPVREFKDRIDSSCPMPNRCSVMEVWVEINDLLSSTDDPNVVGRTDDDDDGTWWEYTIIPAFVVAALILIIGLIIIICIRCRRKNKLEKNEKVVFVQRKKPAVFREEYPMREEYGNQPLITPNEKNPLPPPAYPRSSTPTEDPGERSLNDSSPSYQPPFDSGHEPAGNSRPPVTSYRLPPPYVAP